MWCIKTIFVYVDHGFVYFGYRYYYQFYEDFPRPFDIFTVTTPYIMFTILSLTHCYQILRGTK
jgi:hypothetical protein